MLSYWSPPHAVNRVSSAAVCEQAELLLVSLTAALPMQLAIHAGCCGVSLMLRTAPSESRHARHTSGPPPIALATSSPCRLHFGPHRRRYAHYGDANPLWCAPPACPPAAACGCRVAMAVVALAAALPAHPSSQDHRAAPIVCGVSTRLDRHSRARRARAARCEQRRPAHIVATAALRFTAAAVNRCSTPSSASL